MIIDAGCALEREVRGGGRVAGAETGSSTCGAQPWAVGAFSSGEEAVGLTVVCPWLDDGCLPHWHKLWSWNNLSSWSKTLSSLALSWGGSQLQTWQTWPAFALLKIHLIIPTVEIFGVLGHAFLQEA